MVSAKKGGQELLGGMSITVERNGWGTQVESFEALLEVAGLRDSKRPFPGIFIRAPVSPLFSLSHSFLNPIISFQVLLKLSATERDPPISVIARLPSSIVPRLREDSDPDVDVDIQTIVAIRQGRHLLTTFHPELTLDDRFHEYFVRECVLRDS